MMDLSQIPTPVAVWWGGMSANAVWIGSAFTSLMALKWIRGFLRSEK